MKALVKTTPTNSKNRVYITGLFLLFVLFGFFSQTAAKDVDSYTNANTMISSPNSSNENEKIGKDHYVFFKEVKDRTIKWEVKMKDGKIYELYRDDTLLEKRTYPVYKNMVQKEIADIEKKN